jgi:hypothetical protein
MYGFLSSLLGFWFFYFLTKYSNFYKFKYFLSLNNFLNKYFKILNVVLIFFKSKYILNLYITKVEYFLNMNIS